MMTLFSIPTLAQENCDLKNPLFVREFFHNKEQWRGESSNGTIHAKINFNKPNRSSFKVDDKSAPISHLQLKKCQEFRFLIQYEGTNYKAKLWRDLDDQIVVSVGVPPLLVYNFPLRSI